MWSDNFLHAEDFTQTEPLHNIHSMVKCRFGWWNLRMSRRKCTRRQWGVDVWMISQESRYSQPDFGDRVWDCSTFLSGCQSASGRSVKNLMHKAEKLDLNAEGGDVLWVKTGKSTWHSFNCQLLYSKGNEPGTIRTEKVQWQTTDGNKEESRMERWKQEKKITRQSLRP